MSSFLRIAGAAALVLSFGLAARAIPVSIFAAGDISIQALAHTDAVCSTLNKLIVDDGIVAKLQACLNVSTLAELHVAIAACVSAIKVCADALLKIGAGAVVDAAAQADIVACVAALVTLIVKVCVQLCLKFGVSAVASLCAEIDVCVRLLLVNLDVCVTGIVALIIKAVLSVTVGLMAQVNLAACAKLFIGN